MGNTGYERLFLSRCCWAVEHVPTDGCATSSLGCFQDPAGSSLKQLAQISQLAVRALRMLIGLNGPEQPHLGPPPTPMVPGAHINPAWGQHFFSGLCCRGAGLQFTCSHACPWPLGSLGHQDLDLDAPDPDLDPWSDFSAQPWTCLITMSLSDHLLS